MNDSNVIKRAFTAATFVGLTAASLTLTAPTVLSHADTFTMCPGGHAGVVGNRTSCEFANSVADAFYACGMCHQFNAYSPETQVTYPMVCGPMRPADFPDGDVLKSVNCYGGDQAEVVVW